MAKKVITRNKSTDLNILRRFFQEELEWEDMTDHQRLKVRQVRAAYASCLEAHSRGYTIGNLMKVFDISQVQAYRILNMTDILFGSIRKANKEMKRHIAEEMAKETYRMAKANNDAKAMASATRVYADVTGINNEEPDIPDYSKLQPSLIVTVLPDGMEKQINQLLAGGAVNFNKFQPVEDIPHQEIPNDAE